MIPVSQTYKDTLATGLRNFNAVINITLADGTILPTLTNADLRAFSIDDAVSDDSKFTMLGSTIINQCKITIDNLSGDYFNYNFRWADVVVYIDYPLIDGTTERIRKGTYYVDDDRYVGGTVELTCFDNLAKLDKSYTLSNLDYPATVSEIIYDACNVCGIEFSGCDIPFRDFLITAQPAKENTTFRQILGWVTQIIGCFVRCDTLGRLEVTWCDLDVLAESYGTVDGGTFDSATPYESGDVADGGTFNPWNLGYVVSSATLASQNESHNFYYNYSQDVAIEDTIITGVTIIIDSKLFLNSTNKIALGIKNGNLIMERTDDAPATFELADNGDLYVHYVNPDDSFYIDEEGNVIMETESSIELTDEDREPERYTAGADGYTLVIEKNELITVDTAQQIVTLLGDKFVGMRFRKAVTSHMGDPTIEAGDIAVLWDTKNHSYPIIVTHTEFKIGGQQRTVCGVESPSKNVATRYTESAQAYFRIKEQLRREKTSRELAVESLASRIAGSAGLYTTIEQTSSGNIYYLHERPTLEESQIIWKMTAEAWGVSSDGGQTWNGGMTVDGDTIVRILSATGIDADWIKTGIIQDKNGLNYINLDNGKLQFRSTKDNVGIEFSDGLVKTYDRSSGVLGIQINGSILSLYDWVSDGSLCGQLLSTHRVGTDSHGCALCKPYDANYAYIGYRPAQDTTTVNAGIGVSGLGQDVSAVSYINHVFRKGLYLQSYINNDYQNVVDVEVDDTDISDIKYSSIDGKCLALYASGTHVAKYLDGILLTSYSVRNSLSLNSDEYSDITLNGTTTIRGAYHHLRITGPSSRLKFGYNANNTIEYVDLYSYSRNGELEVRSSGGLSCSGTKNRIVDTNDYGTVALSAYETPTPYFGDIGSAVLDTNGVCYVKLDDIFLETVNANIEYFVFLQKEGQGDLWVANKTPTYFEVNGTPNLKFAWEVKIRQRGYESNRLERDYNIDIESRINYADQGFMEYTKFINQITNIEQGEQ